jgi:hypothetical protein
MKGQTMKALTTAMLVVAIVAPLIAQQSGYPTSGNVTRTDLAPKFEVPAGTKFVNNPLAPAQGGPTPNSVRAWKPEDACPAGQCPYTPDEAARMAGLANQAQSAVGGLAAGAVANQIRSLNENADTRCNGQNGR